MINDWGNLNLNLDLDLDPDPDLDLACYEKPNSLSRTALQLGTRD